MEKYTVTAVGKNRLDILNRISTLYLQKRIPVESLVYAKTSNEYGEYKITCYSESSDIIERIVNQINNIIDITRVSYTN